MEKRSQRKKKTTKGGSDLSAVQQQIPVFRLLCKGGKAGGGQRFKRDLLTSSPETVRALSSVAKNIAHGNVPLSKHQNRLVKMHGKQLRALAHPQSSVKKKRDMLIRGQKGGFLPILAALLPSVIGAISTIFSKKSKPIKG